MPTFWQCLLAVAFIAAAAIPSHAQDQEPSWLFVLQGDVTPVAPEGMTLKTNARALAFTDRPLRRVAFVDLSVFAQEAWGAGGDFRLDPPNASLVDETAGTIGVIEITDASWNKGTMVIRFAGLDGKAPTMGSHIALTIDLSSRVPGLVQ